MILRCLIVDDEPPAHKIIENYIQKMDSLVVAGNCYSASQALSKLHTELIDIVFLDIDMPEITGLEMIRSLNKAPDIILTTAHSHFALESYELGVVDYLLKPIRFERFLKSVNRIIEKRKIHSTENIKTLYVKVEGMLVKIDLSSVQYVEAYGNFLKIHFSDHFILTAEVLSELVKKLPENTFIQIHRSYIINVNFAEKLVGNMIYLPKENLPVGPKYRDNLLRILGVR